MHWLKRSHQRFSAFLFPFPFHKAKQILCELSPPPPPPKTQSSSAVFKNLSPTQYMTALSI